MVTLGVCNGICFVKYIANGYFIVIRIGIGVGIEKCI